MNCAVLKGGSARQVASDSEDPAREIAALKNKGIPVTLVLKKNVPEDVVRAVAYSAQNTLHVFVKAPDMAWAAPLLATADRCGIRRTVTVYPLIPGGPGCADVLERLEPLCAGRGATFLFMFPRIALPVKLNAGRCTVGGREVNPKFVSAAAGGFYPSPEYVHRFMEKVHKYLDCTRHVCGVCGRDCKLCCQAESK